MNSVKVQVMKAKKLASMLFAAAIATTGFAAATTPTASAASCTQLKVNSKDGRVVYLWKCGTQLHAQLVNASTGDKVYLRASNGNTTGTATVASGKTSVNSGTATGTWQGCVKPTNRTAWCGSFGSS